MATLLPTGTLLTWLGDDFTGSAAVMEALTFAGVKSVLFLDAPSSALIARFPDVRAVGIASTARTMNPDMLAATLPPLIDCLAAMNAPLFHYKICSTLDSSPEVGSIGRATELALARIPSDGVPIVVAAPRMRRYQAFGHLFASAAGGVFRLDRHPVMRQHPVTPMDEADVLRHLARQTTLPGTLIDVEALVSTTAVQSALDAALAKGARLLSIDMMSADTDATVGKLIWENRDRLRLLVGSQGIEFALLAYWQNLGLIPPPGAVPSAGEMAQIVVVSGSVSPVTEAQIGWSLDNGFAAVPFDASAVCGPDLHRAEADSIAAALAVLGAGQSPIVFTALGPGDPAVARYRTAVAGTGLSIETANERVGISLGRILAAVLQTSGVTRAVISGGDTSGHGTRQLGIEALTALAPTIPGAALFMAHGKGRLNQLQLALKGGQMGSRDYFAWIRQGGGERA